MAKEQNILICGVNWIGDSIMSMPALQVFRRRHPGARITMLVKGGVKGLWSMHGVPDEILLLSEGVKGTGRAIRDVAQGAFDVAYVFPHSFRSALIPFAARVPKRVGLPGHHRDWMLTELCRLPSSADTLHQSAEYATMLLEGDSLPSEEYPELTVSAEATSAASSGLAEVGSPRVALIPGAARGSSKRWPSTHFAELGTRLVSERGCGIVVLGAGNERELCGELANEIGQGATSLAGRTSFETWVASLALCDVVVANDSGGMHVAAAVRTPVVALYGMTDPGKTGPMGPGCRVLQKSSERARDIARSSEEAEDWLAAISPEEVFEAVTASLQA